MNANGGSKLSTDQVESLRVILERKHKRQISSGEAAAVGESLMELYDALAGEVSNARRGN